MMMGDDIFLAPEITMHEEAGEITIQGHPEELEIDDYEPELPFANGEIPAEISITKVTGTNRATLSAKPKFNVRKDLGNGGNFGGGAMQTNFHQNRPPPLIRGGLPPMPRLRMGGPRSTHRPMHQTHNPLMGMLNMMGSQPLPNIRPMNMRSTRPPYPSHQMMGMPQQRNMPRPPRMQMNGNAFLPTQPLPMQQQQQQIQQQQQQQQQKTMINVPSKAYNNVAAKFVQRGQQAQPPLQHRGAQGSSIRSHGPPPMMRAGTRPQFRPNHPPRSTNASYLNGMSQKAVQVRTVFVPPPMDRSAHSPHTNLSMNHPNGSSMYQNRYPNSNGSGTSYGGFTGEPQIGDEEDGTMDEEELDDVEPDVNPQTNEVDDVEPDDFQQTDYRHEVTISITSVKKQPNDTREAEPVPCQSSEELENQVKKPPRAGPIGRGKKKKKKKKAFRGINYRFDGSSIKKRLAKKPSGSSNKSEDPNDSMVPLNKGAAPMDERDPSVLAYLGIQRKESTESKSDSVPEPADNKHKAKKSFKPASSRNASMDDASSIDSGSSLKRRLSLSEVLSSQKRIRSDSQQSVTIRPGLVGQVSPTGAVKNAVNGLDQALIKDHTKDADEATVTSSRLRPRDQSKVPQSDFELPLQPCVCFCTKSSKELDLSLHPSKSSGGQAVICQAVEVVGSNRVGCKNPVKDMKYRQVLENGKKFLCCDAHIQRLKSHHCCGFCGEFCAHGLFFMCRPNKRSLPHFFHKQCYMKQEAGCRKCPHCNLGDIPITVQLKLSMKNAPLALLQTVSKMSFVKDKTKKSDLILRGSKEAVTYKMVNGKIISSEGLPEGIGEEALKKILGTLEDKQNLKHATRNMYVPVKSGDNVKLVQLLSLGYSPNQRFAEADGGSPLHVAASEGHTLTAHILVQAGTELDTLDDGQNSALMIASIKGRHEVVKYLLQAGADPTLRGDDGMTCLHLATQSGHLECSHVILNQTNLPRNFMNLQDEGGWTPLVWACENKHEPVIKYLLTRGANPLITDAEGNIALHWAALAGSRHTCELLINAGCDVNATNSIGETPIHIALRQDHYECVVLLLMRKARLDIRNQSGQLPQDCMVSKDVQCTSIVNLSTTLQNMMKDCKQSNVERIVCNDLTHAKETNPIQCVNSIDDAKEPEDYVYVSKNCVTSAVPIDTNISKLQHCQCSDTCSSEDSCHCSDLSVKSWYDMEGRLKEGFDFKDPPLIFECNEMCRCNVALCHNRVLQHGITARLQVYRTYGMGWGVKAVAPIQKGSFVCEYVGELISDSEADTREDSYLFDLDNRDDETFCIDANRYGNIARFINHCCTPNLVPVKVFSNHQDLRFPHIALFASRNIAKGEELGFDYGEKFWVIKHKQFTCHCASEKCKYNRNTIQGFLKEYYKKIGEKQPVLELPPQSSKVVKAASLDTGKGTKKVEPPSDQGEASSSIKHGLNEDFVQVKEEVTEESENKVLATPTEEPTPENSKPEVAKKATETVKAEVTRKSEEKRSSSSASNTPSSSLRTRRARKNEDLNK